MHEHSAAADESSMREVAAISSAMFITGDTLKNAMAHWNQSE
jgi:hypothetical protein